MLSTPYNARYWRCIQVQVDEMLSSNLTEAIAPLHTLTGAIVRFLHNRRWSPGWHKTLWFSMTFPFFIVADNYGWVISPCRLLYALWRQEWWQYTWSFLQGTNISPHSIHTFLSAFHPLAHTDASAAVFLSVPLVIQGPGRSNTITRSYRSFSK